MSSIDVLLAEEIEIESCGVKRKLDGEHGTRMSGDDCPAAKRKKKKSKFKNSRFKPGGTLIQWLVVEFRNVVLLDEDTLDGREKMLQWWNQPTTQLRFLNQVEECRREQMRAWLMEDIPPTNPILQERSEDRLWTVLRNLRSSTGPLFLKSANDTEVMRRLDAIESEREQAYNEFIASKKRY